MFYYDYFEFKLGDRMLILVEGIDKSGKSTFINNFTKIVNIKNYRKRIPEMLIDERHSYFKGVGYALIELHNITKFNMIVDRSFISEWVYCNRDKDNKPIEIWNDWENTINLLSDILIVYIHISRETFLKRLISNPDKYMRAEDYDRFMFLYDYYIDRTKIPYIKIPGDIDPNKQIDLLLALNQISLQLGSV